MDIPAKSVYLDYDQNTISLQEVGSLLDEEGYPVAGTSEGAATDQSKRSFIPLTSK